MVRHRSGVYRYGLWVWESRVSKDQRSISKGRPSDKKKIKSENCKGEIEKCVFQVGGVKKRASE
jgi:hypothetical protein